MSRRSTGGNAGPGEIVYRGFHFTHRHTRFYQPVNDLQHFLINPNLPARRTHLCRHMLEQVNMRASGIHVKRDRWVSVIYRKLAVSYDRLPEIRKGSRLLAYSMINFRVTFHTS